MRKVFLDELPRQPYGDNYRINWGKTVGYKVKFIYDDIEDELEIIDVNNRLISIKYNDNIYKIDNMSFSKCKLGNILGKHNINYIYNIGDIINNLNCGKIKILEQIKIKCIKKTNNKLLFLKGYKYKCLICNYQGTTSENQLNSKRGCPVCANQKVLKGYNDMWTTHPQIAKLLKNQERGYEITAHRNVKEEFVCPTCNTSKFAIPSNVTKQGLSCQKCGDNFSYPNKFIFNILLQLDQYFEFEKIFDWTKDVKHKNLKLCGFKRYDFYIPSKNCLIEAHGLQHYNEAFIKFKQVKSLFEQQENDKIKKDLADKNGIENYIIIDCRYSDMDFIKNSVLNSKLAELYDLSKIDWLKCHEYACSSFVKVVCDLWNDGIKNSRIISNQLKLNKCVVIKYLKQGSRLNWCDYDPKKASIETIRSNRNKNTKKIICLELNRIFDSITNAKDELQISQSSISLSCKDKTKSAGKHPITGKPLRWMYYDEYIKQQNKSA